MTKTIEPTEQKSIVFNGDELIAVRADDGTVYVPIRPISDRLNLSWPAQTRRIKRDSILSGAAMSVAITATDIESNSRRPKTSNMLCLPLKYLNGWLFGVSEQRVKPELRAALLAYKEDVYQVLYEAFTLKKPTVAPNAAIDEIIANDPHLSEAYSMAQVALQLIRSQAALQLTVSDHEQRLQLIEADMGNPDRYVTNSQARQVADGVQSVAFALGKRSGRNEHGGVYNELYRRFQIPDYKRLPAVKFDECMSWLRQWHETLTDDSGAAF